MIIGFHGCKGTGKDTAAQFLIDTYDFQKVAFADILKEAVANLFGITREQVELLKEYDRIAETRGHVILELSGRIEYDFTWREFLQRFGTEMGRNTFGQDFWVNQWEDYLYRNSLQEDDIVVTDVRFRNEATKIQEMGGTVVKITRPGHEPDGHASEEPLPSIMIDKYIHNNGSINDLNVSVFDLYKELMRNV